MVKKFALHVTIYREVWVDSEDEDVMSDKLVEGVECILDEGDGEQQLSWELDAAEEVLK